MSGDDFVSSFEERQLLKQDSFELSTMKAVLKQLGWGTKRIAAAERDAGDGNFNWEWFNNQELFPLELTSKRIFSYNFAEVFTAPHKSEAARVYFAAFDNWIAVKRFDLERFAMIFKVHGGGRVLLTNYTGISSALPRFLLPLRKGQVHSLMSFSKFFSVHFGDPEFDDLEEYYLGNGDANE